VVGGSFSPAFPAIRGGQLTLIVRATIGTQHLEAHTQGIVIEATNPPAADLRAALPHDTIARIACQESRFRQFNAAANGGVGLCPLWSGDNLGGVGIFQITRPSPTDEQVWNWRSNAAGGVSIFNQKVAGARGYPARVRNSAGFRGLVTQFNNDRQSHGLPALTIQLPEFTSGDFNNNLQQLELDAIRGYNGWAGHDAFGLELHEFLVQLDPGGGLHVTP